MDEIGLTGQQMAMANEVARMRVEHLASMGICPDGWEGLGDNGSQADEVRYIEEMYVLYGQMTVAEYNRNWCPHHIEAPHGTALS